MINIFESTKIKPRRDIKIETYTDASLLDQKTMNGVVECGLDAFGESMTREEVVEHIQGKMIIVKDRKGIVIAFGSTTSASPNEIFKSTELLDSQGLYFIGTAVRKKYQRRGIYKEINRTYFEDILLMQLPLLFVRTQNPAIEAGIVSTLEELLYVGSIKSYSLERVKSESVYGRQLADVTIPPDSPYRELDLRRGDCFLLFFHITFPN